MHASNKQDRSVPRKPSSVGKKKQTCKSQANVWLAVLHTLATMRTSSITQAFENDPAQDHFCHKATKVISCKHLITMRKGVHSINKENNE